MHTHVKILGRFNFVRRTPVIFASSVFVASIFFFFIVSLANAEPIITNVSGTVNHGQSITVNGGGFGMKATAAPAVWDDASGTSPSQKWSGYWPNCAYDNHQYDLAYRTPIRGVSLPHSRITRYIAGAHYTSGAPGGDCGRNVNVWKHKTVSYPSYTYISWYQRSDPNTVFGMQEGDNNYKIFTIDSPYVDPYEGSSITTNINASVPWSPPGGFSWNSYDGGGDRFSYPDQNGHMHYWSGAENYFGNNWVKIDLEILHTPGTNGHMKFWENGVLKIDYLGKTANENESQLTIGVGGYFRNNPNSNNWRYFADIYFDNYPNRVLLCPGDAYVSRGICENQIPTAWSATSATVSVNLGHFVNGSSAYLYVFDSSGAVNSNGYPVTIGSGSTPDTQPPTSPTSLSATAPSQSSITVSWTAATDNVGVVRYDIERCTGLSCSTFTQVGTSSSSPFVDSGLTASTGYSYHVRAVDAAGNTSGWSNVVSATTQGSPTFSSCSTVTPTNFTDPTYTGYGAPYDVFASNTPLISTQCSSTDTHTLTATLGIPGDTTRIVYTKGYYYDPGISDWAPFTGTCTGALNGEWCQGSVSASITDTDISTASVSDPSYLVGFTCRSQNGSWKCGCRDTSCTNFYWQVQGAGM